MKKSNDNNALARSQRELFVGIRDFIVFKFKRMVVFNGVRDFTKNEIFVHRIIKMRKY